MILTTQKNKLTNKATMNNRVHPISASYKDFNIPTSDSATDSTEKTITINISFLPTCLFINNQNFNVHFELAQNKLLFKKLSEQIEVHLSSISQTPASGLSNTFI